MKKVFLIIMRVLFVLVGILGILGVIGNIIVAFIPLPIKLNLFVDLLEYFGNIALGILIAYAMFWIWMLSEYICEKKNNVEKQKESVSKSVKVNKKEETKKASQVSKKCLNCVYYPACKNATHPHRYNSCNSYIKR